MPLWLPASLGQCRHTHCRSGRATARRGGICFRLVSPFPGARNPGLLMSLNLRPSGGELVFMFVPWWGGLCVVDGLWAACLWVYRHSNQMHTFGRGRFSVLATPLIWLYSFWISDLPGILHLGLLFMCVRAFPHLLFLSPQSDDLEEGSLWKGLGFWHQADLHLLLFICLSWQPCTHQENMDFVCLIFCYISRA